jgi:signal transduction histidine kinase
MLRHPPETRPRAINTTVVLVVYGAAVALGAVFGGIALTQLRSTTEQLEAVIARSAQSVIEVERLHAANDHLGMAARGYLFTQDPSFLSESLAKAQEFRERLEVVAGTIDGGGAAQALASIRALDARAQVEMEDLFATRGQMSEQDIVAMERHSQPLRDQVGAMIEALSRVQEEAFRTATSTAQDAATDAMHLLGTLAAVALVMATGLTIALVRTLRLLARGRVALEQSHVRLEHANQELEAFAGRIAHDLRNVISPLGLLGEMLGQGAPRAETVQRAGERLQRLTRNADRLIGALLDFARAGGQPGTPEPAPVAEVIRDIVADLAALAADRQASVEVDAGDVAVRCARGLLQTILMNLVGNALKYLEGAEQRVVRVSAHRAGTRCEITVADTGPGIPPEALGSIFQPFYRVPGVVEPGTGIGLATVYRIVEAHQGEISVRSRVGEGTCFVVRLPLAERAPER